MGRFFTWGCSGACAGRQAKELWSCVGHGTALAHAAALLAGLHSADQLSLSCPCSRSSLVWLTAQVPIGAANRACTCMHALHLRACAAAAARITAASTLLDDAVSSSPQRRTAVQPAASRHTSARQSPHPAPAAASAGTGTRGPGPGRAACAAAPQPQPAPHSTAPA